jgi:hypothetical protein
MNGYWLVNRAIMQDDVSYAKLILAESETHVAIKGNKPFV